MRNCFLPTIPEIENAVDLLSAATSAILVNDYIFASKLIIAADMPEIARFYKRIAGKTNYEIHLQVSQPKYLITKSDRTRLRMPSSKVELSVFQRDGWRCRFCGVRVISRKTRSILIKKFPLETHWIPAEYERHTSLHSQAASLDHILPHSRGGDNSEENLVTACGPCQFGRNSWTLEEVGFNDPRDRTPIVDNWDGLNRLNLR